jgi:N-acetylglucosamine-6-phosphate deacetylase
MGVETLIRDRFLAAREYLAGHDRVDLELEALAEILQGKRLIHCHSYRQDEILMLCRIAQEFGFRIGTFQHVLEGYKVAEAIQENAIGASAFSDWWAYKVEVQDAIPYNGALMHAVGVSVSFNSDSNELARRLNVEAAKAVKYGGVKPEEALKFVTLNAAVQLAIDDRVGSLEVGKDADFALWSGSPLSTYTRCVATWIDGREYFSLAQDRKHRERIAAERRRLIAKLLGMKKEKPDWEDEDEEENERRRRKRPIDRAFQRFECGVCGCTEEESR